MSWFQTFLYLLIGTFPCILWLLFYLRQDVHPESNRKVIEIYFWGILSVPIAQILEEFLSKFFPSQEKIDASIFLSLVFYIFVVGIVEESLKYFIVKFRVIDTQHFDEPIDAMLYLIISALGFATLENIRVVFLFPLLKQAFIISFFRLLTAIFLHTLSAGITGFFLAFSLSQKKEKRKYLILLGLFLASFFHGLYNFSIAKIQTTQNLFIFLSPIAIIFLMGILVYLLLIKVKKLPRACKI